MKRDVVLMGPKFNYFALMTWLKFPMIVIFMDPIDYPGKFAARVFNLNKPTPYCAIRNSYKELIGTIPDGMIRIPRDPHDDPKIIETWV
ncbi:MAG: hypothetical protein IJV46_06970 [Acidaminococcaceae bacterium]|nr:hypothetical protein [Acidaminococcaceae bacterium]